MSAEYLPRTYTQPLKKSLSLSCTKFLVGIDRCHEDRCIAVILCLLRGHILHIHEYIAGKSQMMLKVNNNRFSRKMTSLALIQFKVQISEIKEAGLFNKLFNFFFLSDNFQFFGR